MGRLPWDKMFWSEWLNDNQLQKASLATKGFWAQCLGRMWESDERGVLRDCRWYELAKLVGCSTDEARRAVAEIERLDIGVVTRRNRQVTLISRRQHREERKRKGSRDRAKRHRAKQKAAASRKSARAVTGENQIQIQSTDITPPISPSRGTGEGHKRTRRPDPLWDALVKAFWQPQTKNERGMFNKACQQLREAQVKPEDIGPRLQAYKRKYPKAAATPTALVSHWGELESGAGPKENPAMEHWRLLDSVEQEKAIRAYQSKHGQGTTAQIAEWWANQDVPF